MTSDELAERVAAVVGEAQGRITGDGHRQYAAGDSQRFETMPFGELRDNLREELLDQINYAVMMILRLDEATREGRR